MVTRKYDFFTWRRSVSLSKRSGTDSALNSKRAKIYEKIFEPSNLLNKTKLQPFAFRIVAFAGLDQVHHLNVCLPFSLLSLPRRVVCVRMPSYHNDVYACTSWMNPLCY